MVRLDTPSCPATHSARSVEAVEGARGQSSAILAGRVLVECQVTLLGSKWSLYGVHSLEGPNWDFVMVSKA